MTERAPRAPLALFGLLGLSAGLPFYLFSTVLALRLAEHGVGLAVIGFFAWVQLLPTFKWAWAPLLDRYDVPGFPCVWGKRRGWIMLAQLGIGTSTAAMAWTAETTAASVRRRCSPPMLGGSSSRRPRRSRGRSPLRSSAAVEPYVDIFCRFGRGALVLLAFVSVYRMGAVFVVYLSMLVNPRYPGAQYAFLSGFAFLLPRLVFGAGGVAVERLDRAGYSGFDLFFATSGVLSLAAIAFLPVLARIRPRPDDR